MSSLNLCIFSGILKEFKTSHVGDELWLVGKGVLFLDDPENCNIGQSVKISCWQDIAERISLVPIGTRIKVVSSYMPNKFKGILYENFNVTSFIVV